MTHAAHILLVEDNDDDFLFIERAFKKARIQNELIRVATGDEALRYLRREGPFKDTPRPDLVLLDLNLPGISGFDVLEAIRTDDRLHRMVVVVLTTSTADEDIVRSYDLFANAYVKKPGSVDDYVRVLRSLEEFWFSIVIRPSI